MEIITNPWFILFNVLNIAALIYLAIKFRCKSKKEPLLFERLRDAGICPTVRNPPKITEQKGGDTEDETINENP